jgi:hypothetical protein
MLNHSLQILGVLEHGLTALYAMMEVLAQLYAIREEARGRWIQTGSALTAVATVEMLIFCRFGR